LNVIQYLAKCGTVILRDL